MNFKEYAPVLLLVLYLGSLFVQAWIHRRTVTRLTSLCTNLLKTTDSLLKLSDVIRRDNERLRKLLRAHFLDENEELTDAAP